MVELAAIRIALDAFPALLRPEFIEGVRPFGSILARAGITFRARPSGFFRLEADEFIARRKPRATLDPQLRAVAADARPPDRDLPPTQHHLTGGHRRLHRW